MNTKILASLLTIGVASAGLGYGTFAYFSDTETSTNNIFTAGTLDLRLNGANGVTGSIGHGNFAPGDTTSGSIVLTNVGSIFTGDAQGHTVDLDLQIVTTVTDDVGTSDPDDGGVSSGSMLDSWITVTSVTYDGAALAPAGVGDLNADGRPNTLADFEAAGVFEDLADPGATGKTLAMGVQFRTDAPNHLKRDIVDLAFTFYLAQAAETDLGATPS